MMINTTMTQRELTDSNYSIEFLLIKSMANSYSHKLHILSMTHTTFIFVVSLFILVSRLACSFVFAKTLHSNRPTATRRQNGLSCRWLKVFQATGSQNSLPTDEESQLSPADRRPPSPAVGNKLKNKRHHENENTDLINKYLFIYCLLSAVISLVDCLYPILTCRQLFGCWLDGTYVSKFIRKYLIGYLSNVLYMLCVVLNILIALNRYFTIFYQHKTLKPSLKSAAQRLIKLKYFFLWLVVACLALNMPYLLDKSISKRKAFELVKRTAYADLVMHSVMGVLVIRYLVLNGIFLVVNLSLAVNAYKYVRNRRALSKQHNRTPETALKTISKYSSQAVAKTIDEPESGSLRNGSLGESSSENDLSKSVSHRNSPVLFLRDPVAKSDWNLLKMSLLISLVYFAQLFAVLVNYCIVNVFAFAKKPNHFDAQIIVQVSDLVTISIFYFCNILEMATYLKYNRRFAELFKHYFLIK